MLIILFLTLLALLVADSKNQPSDFKNPIGNYISLFFYAIGELIIYKLHSISDFLFWLIPNDFILQLTDKKTFDLPLVKFENEKFDFYFEPMLISQYIRSIFGCIYCVSTWIFIICSIPSFFENPSIILPTILSGYVFFKLLKNIVDIIN